MRYQVFHYITEQQTVEPFVPGDKPIVTRHRRAIPGPIIEADNRPEAIARVWDLYGAEFAGVKALDVNCNWCEDQPVRDATEWLDGQPRPTLPCPRCGANYA